MRNILLIIGLVFFQSLFGQSELAGLWISNFQEKIEIKNSEKGLIVLVFDSDGLIEESLLLKMNDKNYSGKMSFKQVNAKCSQNITVVEDNLILSEYDNCSDAITRINSFWIKIEKPFNDLSKNDLSSYNQRFLSLLRTYAQNNKYAFAYYSAFKISRDINDSIKYIAFQNGVYDINDINEFWLFLLAKKEDYNQYDNCNEYLKKYPQGKYIVDINNIKAQKCEEEKLLYESTVKKNDFHTYISKYPKGQYVNNVKIKEQEYLAFKEQKRIEAEKLAEQKRIEAEKLAEQERLAAEQERIKREQERIAYLKNGEGKKVSWTIEVSYKTNSSGKLGDAFLGALGGDALLYTTYSFKYIAVIESVIGENLKVIISDIVLIQPSHASINYIKYRDYAKEKEFENLGKIRVKGFNEVNIE